MAGIFVRIIGLIYRIPMVNIIGDEDGMLSPTKYGKYLYM